MATQYVDNQADLEDGEDEPEDLRIGRHFQGLFDRLMVELNGG